MKTQLTPQLLHAPSRDRVAWPGKQPRIRARPTTPGKRSRTQALRPPAAFTRARTPST
jgi:hypothetical protein